MISANSRYRDSKVEKVVSEDGSPQLAIVPGLPAAWRFNYSYHYVMLGDRPDTLAARHFGDPTMWWVIARANPEILNWVDVAAGTVIRVPSA